MSDSYIRGETIFYRHKPTPVTCPICNQQCDSPSETVDASSVYTAMAKHYTHFWVSTCSYRDLAEHKDAHILWKRLYKQADKWTSVEKEGLQKQLNELRTIIKKPQC